MPRQGQNVYSRKVGLTMPPDVWDLFVQEAGTGYGAQTKLFRKMLMSYLDAQRQDEDELKRQLRIAHNRITALERRITAAGSALRIDP